MMEKPFYPIIYVRGYAGTQGEVEDTVADPYMGFNLGSTKLRQSWKSDVGRHVFESPVVRLMKDHEYSDIYLDGAEWPLEERPDPKTVWIYRYYEPVSEDLGTGHRPEIEDYARGLKRLIHSMREKMCVDEAEKDAFRVYLVAHSMGGLIARCYLQNICAGEESFVDKVFTYASPHGGIDFRLVGNIPDFLRVNNMENFNERRMRDYLSLDSDEDVSTLKGFEPDRFFCLIGTNHRDYGAIKGLSRKAVGPMSDGLVQIKNAYTKGSPRAYVHRSHSGHYGIVNSEEGYQNLRRFLFGDYRADISLSVEELTLPAKVQRKKDQGKRIRASYHFETVLRTRGSRWDLHRRLVSEESAHFVPYDRYVKEDNNVFLATAYLLRSARVNNNRQTLGFSLYLGILVPEYEVDGFLFLDDHYEGGYLFRDKINLELKPSGSDGNPVLKWGVDSRTPNRATKAAKLKREDDGAFRFAIPLEQPTKPGFKGELMITARKV